MIYPVKLTDKSPEECSNMRLWCWDILGPPSGFTDSEYKWIWTDDHRLPILYFSNEDDATLFKLSWM